MRAFQLPHVITALQLALVAGACAEDLQTNDDGDGSTQLAIQTENKGDGVRETTVNASADDSYVHFDLDANVAADADSTAWDLAFSRFKIKTNGGDNGDGDVIVARLAGADFDALSVAPDDGYVADSREVDSRSEGGDPSYAFLGPEPWYDYNPGNHQLSAGDVVYVLRSTEGTFFKIELLGYYDAVGTAGFPRFRWAELAGPARPVAAQTKEPEGSDGAAPGGEAAAFGCYDQRVHTCDCETEAAACESAMGIWTDKCACNAMP